VKFAYIFISKEMGLTISLNNLKVLVIVMMIKNLEKVQLNDEEFEAYWNKI
jgi:hypothetical protein